MYTVSLEDASTLSMSMNHALSLLFTNKHTHNLYASYTVLYTSISSYNNRLEQ